ncbi:MAG: glutamine-synthetase adenylyltransferase, partial [Boseongicola sp.]|nr:glutamine-synthetase adenylyltransferase [Boseongicola sp.]
LGSSKPGDGGFDIKSGPGRRQDLELFAQTGALLMGDRGQTLDQQLKAAAAAFELDSESNSALQQASYLYWHVQAASRLLVKSEVEEAEFGAASLAFLLRQSGLSSAQELEMALSDAEREVAAIIDKYIGTASED